jgi:UDP-N-acetylmuramoylalanine--D-glutamate ligase
MKLEEIEKKKKILILGFGKEGQDAFLFFKKRFPEKEIAIADQNENLKVKRELKDIKFFLGKDYLKYVDKFDLIIKSPGISPKIPEVKKLYQKNKITTPAKIFLENCKGKIIGITGSKGKGQTALLIYEILKTANLKAKLIGNIGKPYLSYLNSKTEDKIFVFEMSSHQLFKIGVSPQIAVLTKISPAHLDFFESFEQYKEAKEEILKWQKKEDFLVYNAKDKIILEMVKKSKAKKIPVKDPQKEIEKYHFKKIPEILRFYSLNFALALKVAEIFHIEKKVIERAIQNFKGLPHRLEFVGKYKGIYFYDDSASTLPSATEFAIENLKGKISTLILGGSENFVDISSLVKKILKEKIKNLILFPDTGKRIYEEILKRKNKKAPNCFFANSMEEAVKIAFEKTEKGKICLLSPAFPSFSLFSSYEERGNLFKKFVKNIGRK